MGNILFKVSSLSVAKRVAGDWIVVFSGAGDWIVVSFGAGNVRLQPSSSLTSQSRGVRPGGPLVLVGFVLNSETFLQTDISWRSFLLATLPVGWEPLELDKVI